MSIAALDGANPRSRATDPTTSEDAGRKVDLNGSQSEVLAFLRESLQVDWTLKELVPAATSWAVTNNRTTYSEQRYRSAIAELEERGLIVQLGYTRILPGSNRGHRVWRLA